MLIQNDTEECKELLILEGLIEQISSGTFDIEELYAEYHDSWHKYHLDELALVVAGQVVEEYGIFEDQLYTRLGELLYLLGGDDSLRRLLVFKWIPKLRAVQATDEEQVFALVHTHSYLKLVLGEIREIMLPLIREIPDATPWVMLLECNLVDSIELLQETICQVAPAIPKDILHIKDHTLILFTCLKVWAAAATPDQLAQISLDEWAEYGLSESNVCDIFASALSTRWSLGEMTTRYTILSNFPVEANANLEQAMVYTLNCINALLDRSGATPALSYPTQQISLDQLLLNWCAENNIVVRPDSQDRRKYRLGEASLEVTLRDNIFWLQTEPVDLDQLLAALV